jgi:hypothetical protein
MPPSPHGERGSHLDAAPHGRGQAGGQRGGLALRAVRKGGWQQQRGHDP